MDNDRVSLTKNANKLGVQQIYVQSVLNEKGWSITKENDQSYQSGLLRRPETRQLKPCWKLMTLMAEKANNHCPGCNWWVIFHKHTTFGRLFLISWEKMCQGRNPSWLRLGRRIADTAGERSLCERWTRLVSGRWCRRLRHAWANLLTSPREASGILNT